MNLHIAKSGASCRMEFNNVKADGVFLGEIFKVRKSLSWAPPRVLVHSQVKKSRSWAPLSSSVLKFNVNGAAKGKRGWPGIGGGALEH